MRRAGPADAAAIRDLTRAVYAKWIATVGREPLPMQADYDAAVVNHWIDLWEDGGRLVALIEMMPHSDHLCVENIAVAEDRQGRGMGRMLVDHASFVAQEAGLPELRLLTNRAFGGNVALYLHLGFEIIEEVPNPLGGSTVYFRKPVSLLANPLSLVPGGG
jgi:N-acetylglutamate synthase-like GNAT family acetyltransferase